MLRLVQGLWNN